MTAGGYLVGIKQGMSKNKMPLECPRCDPMMSFQLQPPSLLPFTLGPPSFHPWLHLCFEPNRNVSLSEWGGGFCSHRHSTIQLMTMELELDSHVVP